LAVVIAMAARIRPADAPASTYTNFGAPTGRGGVLALRPTPKAKEKKKRSKDASAEGERGEEVDGGGERRRRKRRARKKMKSKRGRERAAGPGQIHPNLLAKPSKRNIGSLGREVGGWARVGPATPRVLGSV